MSSDELNLLLVPFPYKIDADDFVCVPDFEHSSTRYFGLNPGWMRRHETELSGLLLAEFIEQLVAVERGMGREIHGVVLPECALPSKVADTLAKELARTVNRLEMLIAGTLSVSYAGPRNYASVVTAQPGSRMDCLRRVCRMA